MAVKITEVYECDACSMPMRPEYALRHTLVTWTFGFEGGKTKAWAYYPMLCPDCSHSLHVSVKAWFAARLEVAQAFGDPVVALVGEDPNIEYVS